MRRQFPIPQECLRRPPRIFCCSCDFPPYISCLTPRTTSWSTSSVCPSFLRRTSFLPTHFFWLMEYLPLFPEFDLDEMDRIDLSYRNPSVTSEGKEALLFPLFPSRGPFAGGEAGQLGFLGGTAAFLFLCAFSREMASPLSLFLFSDTMRLPDAMRP